MLAQQATTLEAGVDGANNEIFEFDFEIRDWLSVAVCAHELKFHLRYALASGAGLEQERRRQVRDFAECDVLHFRPLSGVPAGRRRRRASCPVALFGLQLSLMRYFH